MPPRSSNVSSPAPNRRAQGQRRSEDPGRAGGLALRARRRPSAQAPPASVPLAGSVSASTTWQQATATAIPAKHSARRDEGVRDGSAQRPPAQPSFEITVGSGRSQPRDDGTAGANASDAERDERRQAHARVTLILAGRPAARAAAAARAARARAGPAPASVGVQVGTSRTMSSAEQRRRGLRIHDDGSVGACSRALPAVSVVGERVLGARRPRALRLRGIVGRWLRRFLRNGAQREAAGQRENGDHARSTLPARRTRRRCRLLAPRSVEFENGCHVRKYQ